MNGCDDDVVNIEMLMSGGWSAHALYLSAFLVMHLVWPSLFVRNVCFFFHVSFSRSSLLHSFYFSISFYLYLLIISSSWALTFFITKIFDEIIIICWVKVCLLLILIFFLLFLNFDFLKAIILCPWVLHFLASLSKLYFNQKV